MKWYFNVHQTKSSIRVEIRPNKENDGGYIAARKHYGLRGVIPAVIDRNLAISDTLNPDEANQLVEWLQLATRLAAQLDDHIKTPNDFKKRFEARQYNPQHWRSSYVHPEKEKIDPEELKRVYGEVMKD